MLRHFAILVMALLASTTNAAFKKTTCKEYMQYVYNDYVLEQAVTKELEKMGRKMDWFTGLDCKSASIEKTGPKSANFRVKFNVACWPGNDDVSVQTFACLDINNNRIGDMQFNIDFTATCYKENSNSPSCQNVTSIKNITKKPPAPAPVPKNKWVDTNFAFIPQDVLAKLKKTANEVTPLGKSGATLKEPVVYTYWVFRKESSSGTAYKVDINTSTKSLAKNCPYPFMNQKVQVAVEKATKGGALSKLPKDTKFEKIKVADGSADDEFNGTCLKSAEFKKALAKAKAFAAANSK